MKTQEWQLIEIAPRGIKVLAAYKNTYGIWRRVTARYYLPRTLIAYDENNDGKYVDEHGYCPEGWYEESESHDFLLPCDRIPTHWMPLPDPPLEEST